MQKVQKVQDVQDVQKVQEVQEVRCSAQRAHMRKRKPKKINASRTTVCSELVMSSLLLPIQRAAAQRAQPPAVCVCLPLRTAASPRSQTHALQAGARAGMHLSQCPVPSSAHCVRTLRLGAARDVLRVSATWQADRAGAGDALAAGGRSAR